MLFILANEFVGIKENFGGCCKMNAMLAEVDAFLLFVPLKGRVL